ncbi:MAG: hypothetical protein M1822_008032 [Bathelium mastoideum]|nr:MAG: hypothetical protein M1822_008032 [Bathelium mastoideum]
MGSPKIVFGAGGIGTTATSFTFTWDSPEAVSGFLSKLASLGISDLDSAASYPPGNPWNTETLLGQAKAVDQGFVIDTKIAAHGGNKLDHASISASVDKSLSLLGTQKVHILYSHAPDPSTPLEETAAAYNEQYLAGRFEKLGLCNHNTEQWSDFLRICEENSYVKPSVCQNHYNALFRRDEATLLPLLRRHGVQYYAFSPLAGGFLTGKVTFASSGPPGSLRRTRWEGKSAFKMYTSVFDKPEMHAAIQSIHAVCQSNNLSLTEVALRWLMHHSELGAGDAIILGAKTVEQLENNLADCRKPPLPDTIVQAVENMWTRLQE